MNLRKYAKDKPCLIRVPEECSFQPDQTVLCHVRMIELPLENGKSPDLFAAFGCARCHDIVDGRAGSWVKFPQEFRELMLLQGVMRTQAYLFTRNLIKW